MFLNDKYLFLDSSSSDVFESNDGINNWTLNPNIKIPQTLGVEQLQSDFEPKWFVMTRDGANEYEYGSSPSTVTMVLNNSTTPEPVFYKATSSIKSIINRSLPYSFTDEDTTEDEPLKALNYRVDELENKLRKFGIE